MISSRLAFGFSFRTALTAFVTLALVNPSRTRAVVASSVELFVVWLNSTELSVPPPLTTLSLSSRMSLWALLSPMPLMLLILFMSSAIMAFLISSHESEDSIILAVAAPIPETPIRSL